MLIISKNCQKEPAIISATITGYEIPQCFTIQFVEFLRNGFQIKLEINHSLIKRVNWYKNYQKSNLNLRAANNQSHKGWIISTTSSHAFVQPLSKVCIGVQYKLSFWSNFINVLLTLINFIMLLKHSHVT